MHTRQTLSLIALGFAVAAIVGVSAMAETDLTASPDAALFGDHTLVDSAAAGPEDAVMSAWPCIDAPGCDRPPLAAVTLADEVIAPPTAQAAASPVPLPAALTLLGVALSAAALGLRSRRGAA